MEELRLTVEGIINKTQRLILRNQELKKRISELEEEQQKCNDKLNEQATRIMDMEKRFSSNRIGIILGKNDSDQARQKVDELLREIEKCYTLLNR